MPASATASNHFKYQMANKKIDLAADSIKVLLMRNGFTFNKDTRGVLINLKTNSGAQTLTFAESTKTITRAAGSFITDGFVVGNLITTDSATNPGPFTVTVVAELVLTVTEAVVDEGPISKTVTSNDELATANGYTQDTKVITGQVLSEDDTYDRAEMTCADITWTATGGAIGPSPGAILYDDTTSDNTIIGYLDFGGNMTAPDTAQFVIQNAIIRAS
jgi:hypothetical protein